MKTTMTKKEALCIEYCEKFLKSWEFYTISKDSYLNGFNDALKLVNEQLEGMKLLQKDIDNRVNNMIELDINNHQIGIKSTDG